MPSVAPWVIAAAIHGATRCLGRPDGQEIPAWDDLTGSQRDKAVCAVCELLDSPPRTHQECHDLWARLMTSDGWTHGPSYDFEARTHPCLVPFDELTEAEQIKDKIWASLIEVFRPHATKEAQ